MVDVESSYSEQLSLITEESSNMPIFPQETEEGAKSSIEAVGESICVEGDFRQRNINLFQTCP